MPFITEFVIVSSSTTIFTAIIYYLLFVFIYFKSLFQVLQSVFVIFFIHFSVSDFSH